MDHIYFFTSSGKKNSVFHRHIAAAYHCHRLIPEKCPVACSTVGNAHTGQPFFPGHAQQPMVGSGRQDHRTGRQVSLCRFNHLSIPFLTDRCHCSRQERSSHAFGVFMKFLCQFHAADPRQSGVVIHIIRIEHLTAADIRFLQNQ